MEQREDPDDPLDTVAHRADVLWALDGATVSKPKLEDMLDVSRSTIDRAIRELETEGLVTRAGGKFTATTPGRLAIREYQSATDNLGMIDEARQLLAHVPFPDAPGPAVLADAVFRWPEPPEPTQALEPVVDILQRAERFRGFSRAVADPKLLEDVREQVTSGLDVEFVFTEAMIEHLQTEHEGRFGEVATQENFGMYMTDELPFGLGVAHGDGWGPQLFVVTYTEDGKLRGALYNDTPAAIAWGEDTFRRYREQATSL